MVFILVETETQAEAPNLEETLRRIRSVADYQLGHFGEAIMALRAARKYQPTAAETKKIDTMISKVEAEMKAQGLPLPP